MTLRALSDRAGLQMFLEHRGVDVEMQVVPDTHKMPRVSLHARHSAMWSYDLTRRNVHYVETKIDADSL